MKTTQSLASGHPWCLDNSHRHILWCPVKKEDPSFFPAFPKNWLFARLWAECWGLRCHSVLSFRVARAVCLEQRGDRQGGRAARVHGCSTAALMWVHTSIDAWVQHGCTDACPNGQVQHGYSTDADAWVQHGYINAAQMQHG